MTSRSEAARGSTLRVVDVDGATIAPKAGASLTRSSAKGSASLWARLSPSARSTLSTPESLAASSATPRAPTPATRTWTLSPMAKAAVSAFAVRSESFPPS